MALSLIEHLGGVRLRALLGAFGSTEAIFRASSAELRRVPGIGPKSAAAIRAVQLDAVDAAIRRWQAQGVRIIPSLHPDYPARLAELHDAPPVLFVRGHWDTTCINAQSVAIVGTREPTAAALNGAAWLAADYAQQGWVIVSGLARGIDTCAHHNALGEGQTNTIAVLGGGLLESVVYPPENRPLAALIAAGGGALVSEQPPHAESKPTYLVARNRIITGLCSRVIVVETDIDGGAMHAARRALEQGRSLYTLDLPASGNQALLRAGASLHSLAS